MKVTNVNISLKRQPYSGPLFLSAIADMDPDDAKVPYGGQQIKPAENGRAELEWPDCAPAGGADASVYVKGASWSGRQLIPASGACEGISVELEPSDVPFPSRAEACAIKTHFQGLWVYSSAFSESYKAIYGGPDGAIPYYGSAYIDFAAAGDSQQILQQLKDAGDTHVFLYMRNGGHGYNQNGQPYGDDQLIPAFQAWDNLDRWIAMVDEVIAFGLLPVFVFYAEGDDGRAELYQQLPVVVEKLGDRIKRGPCLMAWDSVWPGSWSVDDMKEGIPRLREIIGPDGFLGFWYGKPGAVAYLWVESDQDYRQPWCDGLDIVLTTDGPEEAEGVSLANKAGYMLKAPDFSQFQPDQGTHFILRECSRGPRFYGVIEYATYQTVRDPWQQWKAFCDESRGWQITMGYDVWG